MRERLNGLSTGMTVRIQPIFLDLSFLRLWLPLLVDQLSNNPCHLVSLPSSVAIWAASDEAAFLHGRFIWSAWDVEELRSGPLRERIEQDENYLRIGVHGV